MNRDEYYRRGVPAVDAAVVKMGQVPIGIDELVDLAHGRRRVLLDESESYRAFLAKGVESLQRQLEDGGMLYGITTGVGASAENRIPSHLVRGLPGNLLNLHGCGTGEPLSEVETAAVMVARLASLSRGFSAVRPTLLERLCELLNRGVLPVVPSEGSVGASGDLTPLSYVAATLVAEREVWWKGAARPAAAVLAELGLPPLELQPKESLALMNGTSVMTGLGCLAYQRAHRVARLAAQVTALMSDALRGNRNHFDRRIFELKPHPGQTRAASWIRDALGPEVRERATLQDRYSIRCAPHVIGVLVDGLAFAGPILETELNGVNDNPIVLPESAETLHGGNFYGGHVAFVMDGLKIALGSVADLLDRQIALLCNPATNNGLPADLVAVDPPESRVHHGFKAMQITASALAAEALKNTMPASSFSRSTESHNQDKVSMGTIAARDCLRIVELTETVLVIALLTACQARDLRRGPQSSGSMEALYAAVRDQVSKNVGDRRQDLDILRLLGLLRAGELPVG